MTTVEIPLTRGLTAIVSKSDEEIIRGKKWHATKHKNGIFYAATYMDGKSVYMHRLLLGLRDAGRGVYVDHKNHNGLDNTRENIHAVTPAQNARNRKDWKSYIGVRGVFKQGGGWVARIQFQCRDLYLGFFHSEREAGIAYATAEKVLMEVFK